MGLDLPAFEQCLASDKYQAAVPQDIAAGARLGVTGPPTVFVDGRLLVGAPPLAAFVGIIDDELARAQ